MIMQNQNIALSVQDVSITYKTLGHISLRGHATRPSKEFTAVRNVSFDIESGQIVGIIGRNGSGKSTLLRSVAGIIAPDSGRIHTFGRSISLLAIGVGFQPNLSGRENILLSGLLLGFSKKEVDARTDEIIAFSELGEFIDKPVKVYSSGMHSKLAFSITAILESDIILVDEVLSVGDARFQRKSYRRMKEIISHEDRTVVIVSHSMRTIRSLCSKVLWLDNGKAVAFGDAREIVRAYEKSN